MQIDNLELACAHLLKLIAICLYGRLIQRQERGLFAVIQTLQVWSVFAFPTVPFIVQECPFCDLLRICSPGNVWAIFCSTSEASLCHHVHCLHFCQQKVPEKHYVAAGDVS